MAILLLDRESKMVEPVIMEVVMAED